MIIVSKKCSNCGQRFRTSIDDEEFVIFGRVEWLCPTCENDGDVNDK